jgi:mannose-6-phosphate isomerase-like protein (cupin superfamily)
VEVETYNRRVPAATQNVVHPDEVEPRREGSADVRTTFDARNGCERLEQRIVRQAAGRAEVPVRDGTQEVMYVIAGRGRIEVRDEHHPLEPGMGVFVPAGAPYAVEADEPLELLSVLSESSGGEARKVTVRLEDQPELEASEERSFRYLINEEAGCEDVTQFLGIVQPSKAPFHSHPYDEVGYIVAGQGIAHIDGEEIPLRAGSCFHLAPGKVHCIENSGPGEMQILGVFHPSGSPANRSYQDNK